MEHCYQLSQSWGHYQYLPNQALKLAKFHFKSGNVSLKPIFMTYEGERFNPINMYRSIGSIV